jgi:hypothetical protein
MPDKIFGTNELKRQRRRLEHAQLFNMSTANAHIAISSWCYDAISIQEF